MGSDPEILGTEQVRLEPRRREREPVIPREPGPPRRLSARQRVALGLAVVAVTLGWWVDHEVAHHEAASISACASALRTVSHDYDVGMAAMYDYVRPSIGPGAAGTQLLADLMARPAGRVLPAARAALRRCRSVRVLAWHSTNAARRDADAAYAAALVGRLVTVVQHHEPFQADDSRLARLRAAAGIQPVAGS